MESPRIVLLLSTLLLLISLFSQVITSDGKQDHTKMTWIENVKSNAEIQALGKFAVDEINEAIERYYRLYWIPNVELALLSFKEVYIAKRGWEYSGATRYTLYIEVQSHGDREKQFIAIVRIVGGTNVLLHSHTLERLQPPP